MNPFKSIDKYFLICKIVTLLFCLPWPLTLLATVMSLAGYIAPDTPMFKVVLIRLAWLLVLVYPVVFFAIVLLAEKVLARKVLRTRGCCSFAACRFQLVCYR